MLQKGLYKKGHDNVFNIIISIIEVALLLLFVFFTLSKWIANNNKDGVNGPGYIPKFEEEEILAEDSEDTETEETTDESGETDIGGSENGEATVENGNNAQAGEEIAGNDAGNNPGFEEEEEINENAGSAAGEENNGNYPGFEEEEEPGENGNGSSDNDNSDTPSEDEPSLLPPKAPTQDGEWGNPIKN